MVNYNIRCSKCGMGKPRKQVKKIFGKYICTECMGKKEY